MAERIPRDESLSRIYGTAALFSAAYGNVGSSIYYALGVTAAFALGLTPLAFILAGVIFIFTAATYAEATVMYPEAGGSSSFARRAFNELISFIAAWGQMLNYTITVAISAYFVPHYFAAIWPPLAESPWDVIAAALVIGGLAVINVRGGQESARLNTILAVADVITQLVLVAVGFVLVFNTDILLNNIHLGVAPTWGNFALGVAVGMIAYTGIETISNMSEEARDAARTVPQGVGLVVLVVMALYLLIPVVALSAMPVTQGPDGTWMTELGTRYADDPMLGIVQGLGLPGGITSILNVYVGTFAGIILIVATNAGLIGVSRLSYSMGQHRQLPESIRRIHPRYRTPWIAIITFACIATITMLPGKASFLATMYAFGAMLSFTIAHAAVIWLRKAKPDVERSWKPPLNIRFGQTSLPLTAILGGLGTAAAWVIVMVLNPITLAVGSSWLVLGVIGYMLYRRHQRLPLTETVKVLLPEPLGVEEVEYRSVLVVLPATQPVSRELIATAAKLTSGQRRAIHAVALVTVPASRSLDDPPAGRERLAREKIERARIISGTRITGRVERVRPGEEGYFIARAARKLKAEAVVLGLESHGGAPRYGRTLEVLMRERPCRVIVVTEGVGSEAAPAGLAPAPVGPDPLPGPAVTT